MRFALDAEKSLEVLRKHGLTLEAAQEVFDQAHLLDRKNDNPEQFRAIGWSGGDSWRGCLEVLYESIRGCEAGSPSECGLGLVYPSD